MYSSEKEMYPEVVNWLIKHLEGIYTKSEIEVFNTSKINLCEFIRRKNLSIYFSEFETYVIKVDITGVIKYKEKCLLAFVECKLKSISLKDISQLIGYSKVVRPTFSLILSPAGISSPVNKLINIYKRYDILIYWENLNIRIAKWNKITKEIDQASLLPHGSYY
jgi:hypothetical protein